MAYVCAYVVQYSFSTQFRTHSVFDTIDTDYQTIYTLSIVKFMVSHINHYISQSYHSKKLFLTSVNIYTFPSHVFLLLFCNLESFSYFDNPIRYCSSLCEHSYMPTYKAEQRTLLEVMGGVCVDFEFLDFLYLHEV